jgi:hypothetical protein
VIVCAASHLPASTPSAETTMGCTCVVRMDGEQTILLGSEEVADLGERKGEKVCVCVSE